MSREELRDGYVQVLSELYEPEAFFERLEDLYLRARIPYYPARRAYWRRHPWRRLKAGRGLLAGSAVLFARLMRHVPEPALRREYRKRLLAAAAVAARPGAAARTT